jgi:hypothetical protein
MTNQLPNRKLKKHLLQPKCIECNAKVVAGEIAAHHAAHHPDQVFYEALYLSVSFFFAFEPMISAPAWPDTQSSQLPYESYNLGDKINVLT